jgi:Glycosyltransferase family 28 N-terminal domain
MIFIHVLLLLLNLATAHTIIDTPEVEQAVPPSLATHEVTLQQIRRKLVKRSGRSSGKGSLLWPAKKAGENEAPTAVNSGEPRAPMRITMITIGSRGDVQPFISLCKGFISDGHLCTIATHLEFQPWIEGFGISFKELKGNPAAL